MMTPLDFKIAYLPKTRAWLIDGPGLEHEVARNEAEALDILARILMEARSRASIPNLDPASIN